MERREPSSDHEAEQAMNAMTETLAENQLDETTPRGTAADDAANDSSEQPMGSELMSEPHVHQPIRDRYAFGSGDRPLDGYTIKRAVGRGGFGEVYYAVSDSGREVALKLILRNLEIERRGVMQCMNLKCPNLLTIFNLETNDAGDSFVIMEYVAGPSLARVLNDHPRGLPPAEVRHWMKGLVEGVGYLHDHGVVHRDLKPANLFLEEGVVKIGDYGLAKLIGSSRDGEHTESIGTCHYMAPEIGSGQYGKPIDVYALGVILHEMLTGRVPFDGETVNEVLMKHLTAQPDPTILPEPYRAIVSRALAKDPRQRPTRLHDLLLPEDAPRAPEIRVIGAPPSVDDQPATVAIPRPAAEPVHPINAETMAAEEVIYIGPDTMPPPLPTQPGRGRGWRGAMRQPGANPRRTPAPAPGPGPGRDWPGRRFVTEPIPPAPLALTGRARVAELAASMLWATLMLALLCLPAAALLEINPQLEPERLAILFGAALAATWTALALAKSLEERRLDRVSRRIAATIAGVAVGVATIVLAHVLRADPTIPITETARQHALDPVYFGLLFAVVVGWSGLAARGRSRRFRLLPIIWAAILGALLSLWWSGDQGNGAVIVPMMCATTIQVVSPWSERAARYAKYLRKSEKDRRKTAAA